MKEIKRKNGRKEREGGRKKRGGRKGSRKEGREGGKEEEREEGKQVLGKENHYSKCGEQLSVGRGWESGLVLI